MWNKSWGVNLGIASTPEIRIGNTYSRIYTTIGFHKFSYDLDTSKFKLSSNFFSKKPVNSTGFDISEPIKYENTNISLGLNWRFRLRRSFIDLNGGYLTQNGALNLDNSKLSDGFEWANKNITINQKNILPFGGVKFGYTFYSYAHITIGGQFYKTNTTNDTEFKIKDELGQIIPFKSDNLHYKIFIGFNKSF